MEIALAGEQESAQWLARGTILRGWALAWQGQGAEGLAQMCRGLSAHRATGAEQERTYFLALLAEGYRERRGAELGVLAEALAAAHNRGRALLRSRAASPQRRTAALAVCGPAR